ncbi:deca-heme c-type cytochrome [Vibrio ponticus]|uniref:Deca-heme c-type cytochrome n=1 Tax=Vibrio ponticus TaxID=265668 RepID=A0A3N3DZV8_9VIBR|nr:multiheme c-type cytochrome [Vibrio ponticus]ROV59936.1 deca-heme c-type cytochrome [Vibrio ponticus]
MQWTLAVRWIGLLFWLPVTGLANAESVNAQPQANQYVGSEVCRDCHQEQAEAWQGSHHDMAMKHADPLSVRGDFADATVKFNNQDNRFFMRGDEYWVNIQGPDGQYRDYQILYTFGWEPLQQYMVQFEDGRVQLIPFVWDTREKQQGGQRWFHLYPDTTPTDEFYWTNSGQNWNFMCADCHSTNLAKNYDATTNTYNTQWSEINVGCEACHGPASQHVELAKNAQLADNKRAHFGLTRDLAQAVNEWVFKQGSTTMQPKAIHPTDQLQTCAQCHSRRTQLNETADHVKGSFLDKYRLSFITPELYHHDGQIYDENYVYGSFLQSAMAEKGVTCTNCHDPHSAKLKVAEEAVCSQCHLASEYTPEKHTFHQPDTEASQCTTCHMPQTTYMQVDPRRDHSWHVPRADISQHINTPNVCTSCHEDETAQWADKQVARWFPNSKYRNQQHFSVAFYADSIGHSGAPDALAYSAQDSSLSDIIRGSALERMGGNTGKNTLVALARAVKHESELIRLGAIEGSAGYELNDRWQILAPLLSDSVLSIRAETAAALVSRYREMNDAQRMLINDPLNEYLEIQRFNSDRGFGLVNLANVHRDMGDLAEAEQLYLSAIDIEPYFENSYANLADLYRSQGKEASVLAILQQGMQAQPKSSALPYSMGLALLRADQGDQAVNYLRQAAQTAESNAQYWYVYGLALERRDLLAASNALYQAYRVGGNPQHLYAQCEVLARNLSAGKVKAPFQQCLAELSQVAPPQVIEQLKSKIR